MNVVPGLVLAIEAAISGGSLSIMEHGQEIASRVGNSSVSRAEELLVDVDEMLTENRRKVADVRLLAISAGPGSFTGIRIGMATGLGLSTGLGIEMATESALKAMASDHSGHRELLVAIPSGRDTVCYQVFNTYNGISEMSTPATEPEGPFLGSTGENGERHFLLHEELYSKASPNRSMINFGRNVAASIGRICQSEPIPHTSPMFISKDR